MGVSTDLLLRWTLFEQVSTCISFVFELNFLCLSMFVLKNRLVLVMEVLTFLQSQNNEDMKLNLIGSEDLKKIINIFFSGVISQS